ncbi:predicted protein [Phaeodactylum tricornutum CCAP 1055/1]|uniref:Guanylate cyclase domain-containing protein n=2 Tax=Phaeodactylum tricornutum TaxID=2850 RepID=B5Y4G2_PHATC|nr:predicted protein [Phaeodactylum tricornutum CCAP 1055/1]ACI65757.1 predicted protein [Phaeodactylum tricornutum CCAP 1055/1]|eukprot:XP_002186287.1 predicted protein [Phaeodactylum tricornutum CCAP 1055/1]
MTTMRPEARASVSDGLERVDEDDISLSSTSESGSSGAQVILTSDERDKKIRDQIIKKEEADVRKAKLIVGSALILSTILVSVCIYIFASKAEVLNFELEHEGYAKNIVNLVKWENQYNFALMQQLSASATASAAMTGSVFPNVTQKYFEITGGYVDGLGGIMATAYAPIIAAEEVTQWETYSQENQGWIGDSTVLRQVHPGHRQPMEGTIQDHEFDRRLDSGSIKPYIWRWEDGEQVQETTFSGNVLAPFWQSSPADAASSSPTPSKLTGSLISSLTSMKKKERKKNPHSFIMEPVYAEFSENPVLVGILIAISAWENLFDRVLPEGTNGLVCVVKDTCGNVFTYEINGEIATHLGYLDLHDERFDQYQRTTPIELYDSEAASLCKHDLYIYPSSTFRSAYNTNRPAIYKSVVALAFAFTALLLLMYDKLIMFADITGFTSWASAREPFQVFELLETIYGAFDEIAKKRRVFKVETVGDCYVAVAGIPMQRKDHAVTMARYARDCHHKMNELTRRLELVFGPDTADLAFRIGLHSGPVTGGVLRGENARFQLFGDTVNTAARMESTGVRNRVHISETTADLLVQSGKEHWLKQRDMKIIAKGKGEMSTFWLQLGTEHSDGTSVSGTNHVADKNETLEEEKHKLQSLASDKTRRLIDWNVEVLLRLLGQIVACRITHPVKISGVFVRNSASPKGQTVLEEVKEIITLPNFNAKSAELRKKDSATTQLNDDVVQQLREYVANVAALYRCNPFHNFEHASHVTMSVVKLLSRIVVPADVDYENLDTDKIASTLHDHTYGITSDPLTQFACVFSALIHDVDPYIAEQNAVDLAWDLLNEDSYSSLRAAIYRDDIERKRFRQLVVNLVMATDIMDADLKILRNARWNKAFSEASLQESMVQSTNRKATIVIEHLIQASDVAHTMQHWHIYRKWNERLFEEMYNAFIDGRAEKNPAEFWYQGELGFFDFYIVPLAKKLEECGVFGVSSEEYLNYALRNRQKWSDKGQQM